MAEQYVLGRNCAAVAVAVYIFVPTAGGWWTKPTFATPKVERAADESFTVDVTT